MDNTIWDGVLAENDGVQVRPGIIDTIKRLDNCGMLQSIASKNEHDVAVAKLNELQLVEFFLYPQINWGAKSISVQYITNQLNIGIDTVAFIDDLEFERDEVLQSCPEVLCIDARYALGIFENERFIFKHITEEDKLRRSMYKNEIRRKDDAEKHNGNIMGFLKSLCMKLSIYEAREEDLIRTEELIRRTNQMNTTGYSYSYDELLEFINSDNYLVYVASLEDKYGPYGKIGVCVIECGSMAWCIKLFLLSCRVMGRGIAEATLAFIVNNALKADVRLMAEYKPNGRNRNMYITYKFAGFIDIANTTQEEVQVLAYDFHHAVNQPEYIKLVIENQL